MRFALVAVLVAASLVAVESAQAGRWYVSSLADDGAGSLRQAIEKANRAGGGEILAKNISGVIRLESPLPTISADIRLCGPSRGVMAVDANHGPGILRIEPGTACVISGLTLSNAWVEVGYEDDGGGAAILNEGSLALLDCRISDCVLGAERRAYGAGILNRGEMVMKRCTVENCRSSDDQALYRVLGGGIANFGSMRIEGSQVLDCQGYFGGGILNRNEMWLVDTVVDSCVARHQGDGGGILNYGALTMEGCVITRNEAAWGAGLGSYNAETQSTVDCRDSVIAGNSASDVGGGLYVCGKSDFAGCAVVGNDATVSGGVFTQGETSFLNCTVSGNAAYLASAIWSPGFGAGNSLELLHCTIVSNLVSDAIVTEGQSQMRAGNSIITCNDGRDVDGIFVSLGHNLFGEVPGVVPSRKARGDLFGVDPRLGPLGDNGGPTPTHALLADSPAIDNGTAAGLRDDQRGFDRKQNFSRVRNGGDGSDIGAYEMQAVKGRGPRRGR